MDINTRRIQRELVVLRSVVTSLAGLVADQTDGEKRRPATFYPNPNNNCLTAFSVGRVPLDKIAGFLGTLYEQLAKNQIGVMLDAVVLKPVSGDPREHSLKKTMFVNLSLCTWTRDAIMRQITAAHPNDKFYDVLTLTTKDAKGLSVLDSIEADMEALRFENECEDPSHARRPGHKPSKFPRTPLVTVEQIQAALEKFDLGDAGRLILPALGHMSKSTTAAPAVVVAPPAPVEETPAPAKKPRAKKVAK